MGNMRDYRYNGPPIALHDVVFERQHGATGTLSSCESGNKGRSSKMLQLNMRSSVFSEWLVKFDTDHGNTCQYVVLCIVWGSGRYDQYGASCCSGALSSEGSGGVDSDGSSIDTNVTVVCQSTWVTPQFVKLND